MRYLVALYLHILATVALLQISPEKPVDFTIKACSYEQHPMHEDTMLV
jgi:hypothetical protein